MTAIELKGVRKRYTKYDDSPSLLTALPSRTRTKRSDLWALRDLDLEVQQGESLGVLGRNGAGKSTLLRLLSGVTAPTSGSVQVRGRVAPLISVGVGFHPELTGRENVYVNATVLGLTRREIDRRFDDIVDFSEIETFIDTPVKFYSSGMFVRLGFAVAVAVEPDVLLVDEVLAVGDIAFQSKCFHRMQQIRARGTTLVVVSHSMDAIRHTCGRALLLHRGVLTFDGEPHAAISAYYETVGQDPTDNEPDGSALAVESFQLVGPDGEPTNHLSVGDVAHARLVVRALKCVPQPILGVTVTSESGGVVYSDTNWGQPFDALGPGERARYDVTLAPHLAGGAFIVSCTMHDQHADGQTLQLTAPVSSTFHVSARGLVLGVADLEAAFTESRP